MPDGSTFVITMVDYSKMLMKPKGEKTDSIKEQRTTIIITAKKKNYLNTYM